MREYVLTLLITAAVTYLLTPLVRRGAIAAKAMHAARDRDVHVVPIPLLGGLAMYGGLVAGLLVATQLSSLRPVLAGSRMSVGLLMAGGLIVAVGVVDDRWGLGPVSKLAGQVAAGAILVWSGAELNWVPLPGGETLILDPNQGTVLTILVVVVTINAVNFIDGLDGLAAGIVCIAATAFFAYYYTLTQVVRLPAQAGPALASAILVGACLGFLPHNFYPARIFMGDTGSMLLGLLLAYVPVSSIGSLDPRVLTTYSTATVNRFAVVLPLLLPAALLVIPYADLLLAVIRRTRAGRSPLAPDRQHLHHRLLDVGHSHRSSVLIMYLWAAVFSGTVVWLSVERTKLFVLAIASVLAVLALLPMSMPRLRFWRRGVVRTAGAALAARPAAPRPAAPRLAGTAGAGGVAAGGVAAGGVAAGGVAAGDEMAGPDGNAGADQTGASWRDAEHAAYQPVGMASPKSPVGQPPGPADPAGPRAGTVRKG